MPAQAPAESALDCRAQIKIVKANVEVIEVIASRLQESNCSQAGSGVGRGADLKRRYSWHTDSPPPS